MLTSLSRVASFNHSLLERMLADISADQFCQQPPGLPNHPAWLVGHLAFVRVAMLKQLGDTPTEFPEAWLPLFGRNSTPNDELANYPSKTELWDVFSRLQQMAITRVMALTPEQLEQPHGIETFKKSLPTLGDLILQMLVAHDGLHVGQLSDWRRALGYPRLM
jgi:hypothetical protein